MFGMGGSEIIVILIVALLFLGPDKLPQAAKQISKGIRDIKKQSRALQQQIESDEQIGGAIRDLKSALRGEELPIRPKPKKPRPPAELPEAAAAAAGATAALGDGSAAPAPPSDASPGASATVSAEPAAVSSAPASEPASEHGAVEPGAGEHRPVKLPPTAGEPDPIEGDGGGDDDLASLIKPAPGAVAKGT